MTTNLHPEMSPVNSSPELVPAKKSKVRRNLLLATGSVAVITISTTLAANISINAGENVEFGQGVLTATACDDQITITPYSSFINAEGAGSYKLTSIKLSGIDSREGHCAGKEFLINVYGENAMLDLVNYTEIDTYDSSTVEIQDYNFVEITNADGNFTWTSDGTDGDDVTSGPNGDLEDTSFTINFTSRSTTITRTPLAPAGDVKTITVQSRNGN